MGTSPSTCGPLLPQSLVLNPASNVGLDAQGQILPGSAGPRALEAKLQELPGQRACGLLQVAGKGLVRGDLALAEP